MTTGLPRIASLLVVLATLAGCQTTKTATDATKTTVDATNRTGPKDAKTFEVASVGGTGPDVDFAAAVAAIASDPSSGVRQVGGPSVLASAQTRVAAAPARASAPSPVVAYSPQPAIMQQVRQVEAVRPLVAAPVPVVTTVSSPQMAVASPAPMAGASTSLIEPDPEPRRIRRF